MLLLFFSTSFTSLLVAISVGVDNGEENLKLSTACNATTLM